MDLHTSVRKDVLGTAIVHLALRYCAPGVILFSYCPESPGQVVFWKVKTEYACGHLCTGKQGVRLELKLQHNET